MKDTPPVQGANAGSGLGASSCSLSARIAEHGQHQPCSVPYDLIQEYRIEADIYDIPDTHTHRVKTDYPKEGACDEGTELKLDFQASWLPPGTRIRIEVPACPECYETADMNNPWHSGEEKPPKWPKCNCGFDWANWTEDQYS